MKVKAFSETYCSRLVRLVVVRNLCGQLSCEMVSRYGMSSYIRDNCVLHVCYQVFDGINKCNISNNGRVYDIL
jgi:hypothetical protein